MKILFNPLPKNPVTLFQRQKPLERILWSAKEKILVTSFFFLLPTMLLISFQDKSNHSSHVNLSLTTAFNVNKSEILLHCL